MCPKEKGVAVGGARHVAENEAIYHRVPMVRLGLVGVSRLALASSLCLLPRHALGDQRNVALDRMLGGIWPPNPPQPQNLMAALLRTIAAA
jgi:hypothetical protein